MGKFWGKTAHEWLELAEDERGPRAGKLYRIYEAAKADGTIVSSGLFNEGRLCVNAYPYPYRANRWVRLFSNGVTFDVDISEGQIVWYPGYIYSLGLVRYNAVVNKNTLELRPIRSQPVEIISTGITQEFIENIPLTFPKGRRRVYHMDSNQKDI